jgi:hypothetical protein
MSQIVRTPGRDSASSAHRGHSTELAPNYGDLLRAIGRYLDEHDARDAQVVQHEHVMAISWLASDGGNEKRSYTELDLRKLRDAARRLRGGIGGPSRGEMSDLMRTLGQELDVLSLELSAIRTDGEAFVATGRVRGEPTSAAFTFFELRELNVRRRAMRGLETETVVARPLPPPPPSDTAPRWQFWSR